MSHNANLLSAEEQIAEAIADGEKVARDDVFTCTYIPRSYLQTCFAIGFVNQAKLQNILPANTPMYLAGRVACAKGKKMTDKPEGEPSDGRWMSGWLEEQNIIRLSA